MANIGDVFFRIGLDGSSVVPDATKIGQQAGAAAGTAGGTSFGARFKQSISKQNIGQGLVQGLGLGAGLVAFSAVNTVISGTVNFLGEATDAAREEGVAVASLTQALEANVAGWDGNIEAIEEVISAREELGFADDEQRESLARLVSITKDENEALELQRQAMDLARLRGISLTTASEILGKVYGGNVGILSRYGIQLEKGTTATEALAEIQRRASGQAEAFAETEQGAADAAGIAFDNLKEDVGSILLPIVKELALFGRDVLIPFLRDVVKNVKAWVKDNKPLLDTLGKIAGVLGGVFFTSLGLVIDAAGKVFAPFAAAIGIIFDFIDLLVDGAPKIGNAAGQIVGFIVGIPGRILGVVGKIAGFFLDIARRIVGAIADGVGKVIEWILSIPGKILGIIGAVANIARDAAAALLAPFITVAEKIGEIVGSIGQPAGLGRPPTPQESFDYRTKGILPKRAPQFGGKSPDERAMGGSASMNRPYLVGERGPELFVPSSNGGIVPNHALNQVAAGAAGNTTINVPIQGLIPYRDAMTIPNQLKRLRDFGVLTPRREPA